MGEWEMRPSDLRLLERIAVGGFAEVFRATWKGTMVAVKQLLERGPDVVARLREEALVLARLRHPNLLLFMGWCAEPPLIATEFMRRGSLHNILRRNGGPLSPPRTHHVAVSVARGMQYLHSRAQPILHLDLKSPNILLDDKWRVKIADFGLARVRRNTLFRSVQLPRHPEWMAPEMLRAERYDEKADVYSFGVVLWELLSAQTPWNELHPMQVVAVGVQRAAAHPYHRPRRRSRMRTSSPASSAISSGSARQGPRRKAHVRRRVGTPRTRPESPPAGSSATVECSRGGNGACARAGRGGGARGPYP